jgi:hypothetical protein
MEHADPMRKALAGPMPMSGRRWRNAHGPCWPNARGPRWPNAHGHCWPNAHEWPSLAQCTWHSLAQLIPMALTGPVHVPPSLPAECYKTRLPPADILVEDTAISICEVNLVQAECTSYRWLLTATIHSMHAHNTVSQICSGYGPPNVIKLVCHLLIYS